MLWTRLISSASDPALSGASTALVKSNAITISPPQITRKGDMLIAVIVGAFGNSVGSNPFIAPSDWTMAINANQGLTGLGVAYYFSDGSNSSLTFQTSGQNADILVVLMSVSDSRWDNAGSTAKETNTASSCLVSENASLLFGVWAAESDNPSDAWSVPTGMNIVFSQSGAKPTFLLAYQNANAGDSGTRTTSSSASNANKIAQLFSVKPA